jgi:hypothetical protein
MEFFKTNEHIRNSGLQRLGLFETVCKRAKSLSEFFAGIISSHLVGNVLSAVIVLAQAELVGLTIRERVSIPSQQDRVRQELIAEISRRDK